MPYSYKVLKDLVKDGVQCLTGSTVVFEEETEWEGYLEPISSNKKGTKSNKKTEAIPEQANQDTEEATN